VGYSGVKGGMDAILAAERLVRRKRAAAPWSAATAIIESYRLAVDRVMGEAGLYDEAIAADAFRQAEGDLLEAAHLVRAYRSSLPRLAVSTPADPDEMTVLRRIVPASRTPGGPQLLGRTTDYTARVLERPEAPADPADFADGTAENGSAGHGAEAQKTGVRPVAEQDDPRRPRRFYEQLLKADLAVDHGAVVHSAAEHGEPADDPEPFDVSRGAARPPAPRSAVLASMARAETGALIALWYRSIRGPDGAFHEVTLGEVRHGRLPVRVVHPLTGNPVEIGQIRATETEAIEDLNGPAEDRTRLDVGYGMCFGHNERKAIAMANLDIAFRRAALSEGEGDELEQLLLLTTDGLDSSGFLEHLKLPHYVTFRSIVDRKLASRAAMSEQEQAEAAASDMNATGDTRTRSEESL
jgi:alpha-D-ribose 1-methylphosphonate 5-triphosphate synthase subunit PhnI